MSTRKTEILSTLTAFVNQRPGLEFANYGDVSAYRSDYRGILQAKHDYEAMLNAILLRDSITADDIIKGTSAFSGRLTITETVKSGTLDDIKKGNAGQLIKIEYCTGQYFPTEYRNAACAVLASVLWDRARKDGYETGDDIRKQARKEFGRGIGSRWFN